jgi:uncharacterized protein (TIGR02246 family)
MLTLAILGLSCLAAQAQEKPKVKAKENARRPDQAATEKSATETAATEQAAIEKAVREGIAVYVTAFNKGDAEAVAAQFAEHAEFVNARGEVTRGREAIAKQLQAFFAAHPGAKAHVHLADARLVTPDVILERGTSEVALADGALRATEYSAVNVRRDGRWTIESLIESDPVPAAPVATAADHLADLGWMVGHWVDESPEATIVTTCNWSAKRNFLTRAFTVHIQGRPAQSGLEIIGWDPAEKAVRSWYFDSDGGFGQGQWSRDGDRWTVTTAGTLPGGGKASAVHVFTRLDGDSFGWKSTDRAVDGALQPDIDEVTIQRLPEEAPSSSVHKR